jgi:PAS domain S-box-containing protein
MRINAQSERFMVITAVSQGRYDASDPSMAFHLDGRPYRAEERPLGRALRLGETVRGEELLLRLPGQPDIVLNVSAAPIHDADGRIISAVQTVQDVTEQRLAEVRLRQQDEVLRALIDQFPASINILDRQFTVVMAGGMRGQGTGITVQDVDGRHLSDILSPAELAPYRADVERALAGETISSETRFRDRTIRATLTPLRSADGTIDKVLTVAFDVTEDMARIERAARDEKLRALGQMAGGIAHDLNQALTLVSGYGELAREALQAGTSDADGICEMIRIMERAAYDGGDTVKQLLTFARGGEHEQMQPLDVDGLLHDVEQLTAPRWRDVTRAEGRPVTLRVEAAPGLTLYGSQGALREALTNLVFNALDAMPSGGSIVLAARQQADQIAIDVADTGTGMLPEVKARVFEPFFTTKGERGTGLGMAMVFGIVERHGGQIDISTELGAGTTIHLTFPAADVVAPDAADPIDAAPVTPLRVLVVDDERRLATLLVGMLRYEGHAGVTAISAEEALERLRVEAFDLVITDLSMGDGMNGWELAAAIAGSARPVPVVLATGWGAGLDPEEASSRGVSGVLAKPYRRADLRAVIAQALAGQG